MTAREIELSIYAHNDRIATIFKDMQAHTATLQYAENREKNAIVFSKLKDYMDEVNRLYSKIDELDREIPEEEEPDDGFSFNGGFSSFA